MFDMVGATVEELPPALLTVRDLPLLFRRVYIVLSAFMAIRWLDSQTAYAAYIVRYELEVARLRLEY